MTPVRMPAADVDTRTEKQLEAQVKQLARMYGYIYYHTQRSQFSPSGFPDCHMIHVEQKRIIYAELKRTPKDKLRPAQEEYRDALLAVGAEWYRWDWSTSVESIIAILMRRPRTIDRATPGGTIEITA